MHSGNCSRNRAMASAPLQGLSRKSRRNSRNISPAAASRRACSSIVGTSGMPSAMQMRGRDLVWAIVEGLLRITQGQAGLRTVAESGRRVNLLGNIPSVPELSGWRRRDAALPLGEDFGGGGGCQAGDAEGLEFECFVEGRDAGDLDARFIWKVLAEQLKIGRRISVGGRDKVDFGTLTTGARDDFLLVRQERGLEDHRQPGGS